MAYTNAIAFDAKEAPKNNNNNNNKDGQKAVETTPQGTPQSLYYDKNMLLNNMRRELREFKQRINREKYDMENQYKRM
jgi:hypothetical protein